MEEDCQHLFFETQKTPTKDIFAFILGLTSYLSIRMIGVIYISEFICLCMCPFIIAKLKRDRRFIKFYMFLFLWILGSAISNFVNEIDTIDFCKGVFSKGLIIFLLPVMYWTLQDKPMRILYYGIGKALSGILAIYVLPSVVVEEFNVVDSDVAIYFFVPMFSAGCGALFYAGLHRTAIMLLLSCGVFTLFYASRNIFLSYSLAAFFVWFSGRSWQGRRYKKVSMLKLMTIAFIGMTVTKEVYEYAVSNNVLGEKAYNKYVMQSEAPFGLISARADFFMTLIAISERPIFGYGDYAKDNTDIRARFMSEHMHVDISPYDRYGNLRLVPGHSQLLGAWVYNGILALPFWLYALYLLLRGFMYVLPYCNKLRLYVATFSMMALFNIFVSPFGNRMSLIVFVFFIVMMKLKDENIKAISPVGDSREDNVTPYFMNHRN